MNTWVYILKFSEKCRLNIWQNSSFAIIMQSAEIFQAWRGMLYPAIDCNLGISPAPGLHKVGVTGSVLFSLWKFYTPSTRQGQAFAPCRVTYKHHITRGQQWGKRCHAMTSLLDLDGCSAVALRSKWTSMMCSMQLPNNSHVTGSDPRRAYCSRNGGTQECCKQALL